MKILVVLPRFPYPLEKGDKLRAYNQIRTLAENNEVYLFALSHCKVDESALQEMRKYCKDICVARLSKIIGGLRVIRNLFSVRSLQIGYWDDRRARRRYRDFEAQVQPDVIYAQMVRTMKYVAHSSLPKVLDFQDALSMNVERRMLNHRGLPYFFLHYEFKMLRSAEFNACGIFDRLTIISETDSDAIPQHKHTEIDIVRNGVDFDYFNTQALKHSSTQTFNHSGTQAFSIVFCGNMQYRPNVDASQFLVNEVMPIVWRTHPEARVLLAGATPKKAVRQLASDKVTITGSVDDIRPCYASARLFVAPMRIGSGLQNKLLEAMAMGVPCITTPLANASLGAVDGKHLLLAADAESLAAAIIRLLDGESLCQSLVANADTFVHENFSWQSAGKQLESVLQHAIAIHSGTPTSSWANHNNNNENEQLEDE